MRFEKRPDLSAPPNHIREERIFARFTLGQRWEHAILLLTFLVLLLTGLPQVYRATWGHNLLTTPERVVLFQQVHHTAALVLICVVIYHIGHALIIMFRGRLSAAIFPTWQDLVDAWKMVKYLLFLSREKPRYGKYNFEQKFTYWFIFFGIGIMVMTGLIVWFPEVVTRILPGGVVPAAKLAHRSEAIAAGVFILIWHLFHVLVERFNPSMFTGWLNESDMRQHHSQEYQRLNRDAPGGPREGDQG
jgi:formate dehydrogenase gamma subunit